jgi:radical SAM protein with 4Fe4S-binding SPASM domain
MLEQNVLMHLKSPLSVNLEVTEKCNLSCSFCFNAAPLYSESMAAGEKQFLLEKKEEPIQIQRKRRILSIIDKLCESEVFEIRLFGGEFTVFKFWREIAEYIASKNMFISFVSNGYLFSEEDIGLFARLGLRECNISVHGPEEIHDCVTNKPGSFKKAMQSIQFLHDRGITVSVAYTPNMSNLDHLYEFVKELKNVYNVQYFGINRLFQDERYRNLTLENYHNLLDVIDSCSKDFGVNIFLIDSFPRCAVKIKHWKYLAYCSQGVGFAQVDFNGNIKHCSAINKSLGNVLLDDMDTLWQANLQTMRSLEHLPKSCKICPIFCGGGCTASRGVNHQFVPDEFIPWPHDETLVQSYSKAIYNLGRRMVFNLFHEPGAQNQQVSDLPEFPILNKRYRVRKEDDETYVAMFESSGIRILTPLAKDILELLDGKSNISDIHKQTQILGHNCSETEILEIVQDLM